MRKRLFPLLLLTLIMPMVFAEYQSYSITQRFDEARIYGDPVLDDRTTSYITTWFDDSNPINRGQLTLYLKNLENEIIANGKVLFTKKVGEARIVHVAPTSLNVREESAWYSPTKSYIIYTVFPLPDGTKKFNVYIYDTHQFWLKNPIITMKYTLY